MMTIGIPNASQRMNVTSKLADRRTRPSHEAGEAEVGEEKGAVVPAMERRRDGRGKKAQEGAPVVARRETEKPAAPEVKPVMPSIHDTVVALISVVITVWFVLYMIHQLAWPTQVKAT